MTGASDYSHLKDNYLGKWRVSSISNVIYYLLIYENIKNEIDNIYTDKRQKYSYVVESIC